MATRRLCWHRRNTCVQRDNSLTIKNSICFVRQLHMTTPGEVSVSGPPFAHGLTLISAWISNYVHYSDWTPQDLMCSFSVGHHGSWLLSIYVYDLLIQSKILKLIYQNDKVVIKSVVILINRAFLSHTPRAEALKYMHGLVDLVYDSTIVTSWYILCH